MVLENYHQYHQVFWQQPLDHNTQKLRTDLVPQLLACKQKMQQALDNVRTTGLPSVQLAMRIAATTLEEEAEHQKHARAQDAITIDDDDVAEDTPAATTTTTTTVAYDDFDDDNDLSFI